ncbi:MAG: metal-dependent hydrolase [Micrococcaceae bacterium]|nr:metal-dependent hydrolase [Micrococcaceae bacterium]
MMGGHHAATGAAAWIALTTNFQLPTGVLAERTGWLPEAIPLGFGLLEQSPLAGVAGAMVCAGAALLPDADHRRATIAHSLPPVSNAICAGIGEVSGGHRNGTHSLAGIAVFTAMAWVLGLWTMQTSSFGLVYPGAGLLAVLLVSFALKALKFIPDSMAKLPWIISIPAGIFVAVFSPDEQNWLVLAVAVGCAIHVAGDMLTVGGCNLLWPIKIKSPRFIRRIPLLKDVWKPGGRIAVPVLGRAGSLREWLMCVPVSIYALAGLVVPLVMLTHHQVQPLTKLLGF